MKISSQFGKLQALRLRMSVSRLILPAILAAASLAVARPAAAQTVPDADKGGYTLIVGGAGYQVGYGQQKLLGPSAFVDIDTTRRFGLEGEARWLQYHQSNDVHATTWLAGPRYHFTRGRLQFYVKGLVGMGQFQFPYDYAQGNYLVIAPGGGVDYRWKRRISFRLADFEYQEWPQFTYGAMNSYGVSVGIRYHIF